MDEHRFAEADAMISSLLTQESGLVGLHRAILSYDGACLALLDGRTAALDTLLGQTEKQLLKQMKGQPTALRTEYFLALLLEKDEKKAAAIRAAFDKCARTYPYPNDLALDRELMDKADELYAA